ncbi:putative permease [Legionella impletisoli]|uniref:Permease n=2 Tax=Legionella impletisoli TaxID=343510 RepID=A0A917N8R0_9GAMM|nr:putative permease [Legionella impletisoli]
MNQFFTLWAKSAQTSFGLFWMAFWAFAFGYLISSMIQVLVTRKRMQQAMGKTGVKSVALGTFFGFISSSCSFAALATTRAIFSKGAGLIPSLAFLLASTNLVIELGIVIAVFLSWQFVVGEYLGGILLILFMWVLVKLTLSKRLEKKAREHVQSLKEGEIEEPPQNWRELIVNKEGWYRVSKQYLMEWKMVWKDITIGFTVAGIIAAFVPKAFFETLFVGSSTDNPAFWQILLQTLVGPVAAFFTFIGSMGNIPLAAVLFSNGVSFAGIMAFIFSDLIVFPVLRIQTKYYGLKMAMYILAIFLVVLVISSLVLHYGFALFDLLPQGSQAKQIIDRTFFAIDYTLFLNMLFILMSILFLVWHLAYKKVQFRSDGWIEKSLFIVAIMAILWLVVGLFFYLFLI